MKKKYKCKIIGRRNRHLADVPNIECTKKELAHTISGILLGARVFRYDITIEVYESVNGEYVLIDKFR